MKSLGSLEAVICSMNTPIQITKITTCITHSYRAAMVVLADSAPFFIRLAPFAVREEWRFSH